ncbi:MAG: hypothetical protein N2170_01005 [Bacteroidia bacterium]|nr:hypothetical protein [Bacteroidia bacterium]
MDKYKLWSYLSFFLSGVAFVALFLPLFRVVVWDTGKQGYLFLWGGHGEFGASVPAVLYGIAGGWGLAGVVSLVYAGELLRRQSRSAIAWMNWAAFFLAMELIFLLVIAEEILTDLRVQELHADSFAQVGSWLGFLVLIGLLFLPGRARKALFPRK